MNNPIQTPQSSTSQPNAQEISIKDKSSSNREMSRRVKENCRALLDNFTEIIRLSKVCWKVAFLGGTIDYLFIVVIIILL